MAYTWQQFEKECYNYLENKYGMRCAITVLGQSDSTIPDIGVTTQNSSFYIEVKEPNAQSGQFVLLPDEKKEVFVFSPRNKTNPNEFTEIITNYMNADFERFNSAGTVGQSLDIDNIVFCSWIVNYYKTKGVKYFISKGSDYIIFPVNKFSNYFDITAKYRIKRSGSSQPSKIYQAEVNAILKSEYGITKTSINDKKLFAYGTDALSKIRFIMGNYEYYLAPKESGIFEVRQLSNTYNMNVIFSITLKNSQNSDDLLSFESEL